MANSTTTKMVTALLIASLSSQASAQSILDAITDSFSAQLNPATELVKTGAFDEYPQNTIGNAFEYAFDDATWQNFSTDRGEVIVQFDGKISEQLHTSVIDGLNQQFKTNPMSFIRYSTYMISKVVEQEGRVDSTILATLDSLYGCKLIPVPQNKLNGKTMTLYSTRCANSESDNKYLAEFTRIYMNRFWAPGAPVSVQWTVHADGSGFDLSFMGSDSWENLDYTTIISEIYK